VSADAFPVPGRRAWTFHFGPGALDEAQMLAHACQVLSAAPSLVEASFRRDHTMPVMALGHDQWLQALDQRLAGTGLLLVGNYLAGLSIEDCAGRALSEFRRAFQGD
jgi:protoporphyrinogen oxidase